MLGPSRQPRKTPGEGGDSLPVSVIEDDALSPAAGGARTIARDVLSEERDETEDLVTESTVW